MPTGVTRGRAAPLSRVALVACLVASGCASTASRNLTAQAARDDGWAWVEDVPEVRQVSSDGCGAAALAMVLGRWGLAVTQDEIRAAIPAPPAGGLRADALRDFARRQDLRAFVVEGNAADLEREVRRNRPVVVGVMKRRGRRAYPHYEVVVGLNRERQRILTLDPARGRRERSVQSFAAEWAAAGRLTLVVFPRAPAVPPVSREAAPGPLTER